MTSNTAHPHATGIAVYPALLQRHSRYFFGNAQNYEASKGGQTKHGHKASKTRKRTRWLNYCINKGQIVLPFCPAQAGSFWDVKHFLWAASPHFSHSTPCKNKCLSQSRHLDGVLNRWKVCVFALSDIVRPAELPAPVEKIEWQFGEIVVKESFCFGS